MITEQRIQNKAKQYLDCFQTRHRQNANMLKQLEIRLNRSAKIIQSKWRQYIRWKKNQMAKKIQKMWRKYWKCKIERIAEQKRFKETFMKGKIAYFILKKFFPSKLKPNQTTQSPIKSLALKNKAHPSPISSRIAKYFSPYIRLSEAYSAEQKYIQRLRVYEKQRFSQNWQRYEQSLKLQLRRQVGKKWVRKSKQIWISQQSKEVNLEEYIEKQVGRIFKRQYERYKLADDKLSSTAHVLGLNIGRLSEEYLGKVIGKG